MWNQMALRATDNDIRLDRHHDTAFPSEEMGWECENYERLGWTAQSEQISPDEINFSNM